MHSMKVTGPPANFPLSSAFQDIPGLAITAYFDDEVILLIKTAIFHNPSGTEVQVATVFAIDGIIELNPEIRLDLKPGYVLAGTGANIYHVTSGQHTITVKAVGKDEVTGEVVLANRATLALVRWS